MRANNRCPRQEGARMSTLVSVAALLLCWFPTLLAAVDKPVLEIAPTLSELGKEWTTNQLVLLIDPLGKPPQIVCPGNPDPEGLLATFRQMMKSSGRTGYLRMHYGRGDLVVNQGAYHVYLQRWTNADALNRVLTACAS